MESPLGIAGTRETVVAFDAGLTLLGHAHARMWEAGLTPIEEQVTWYRMRGTRPVDIAERLCLSESTIKIHLRVVRRKLRIADERSGILPLLEVLLGSDDDEC